MAIVVEQFDAVKIINASIQFFKNGVQQAGTKFGAIGTLEGETELKEFIKMVEGVEQEKITRPIKMNITVSAHIPVQVARDLFGLSVADLKPGVWAYGKNSKGTKFVLTGDVIDEFQDVKKLIAFPNCISNTGLAIMIENGADELAELEIECSAMLDENGQLYYEAIEDELEDPTVATQWHTQFNRALVEAIPLP